MARLAGHGRDCLGMRKVPRQYDQVPEPPTFCDNQARCHGGSKRMRIDPVAATSRFWEAASVEKKPIYYRAAYRRFCVGSRGISCPVADAKSDSDGKRNHFAIQNRHRSAEFDLHASEGCLRWTG